jgi:hypothetical protein
MRLPAQTTNGIIYYSNTPLPRPSPSRLQKGDAVLRESFPARIAELPFNGGQPLPPHIAGASNEYLGGYVWLGYLSGRSNHSRRRNRLPP